MKKPDGHPEVPLWKLERYLLGELPHAEMERIGKLREADPALASWIEALKAEYRDLETMHPTGRVAGRIWNKLRGRASAGETSSDGTNPVWAHSSRPAWMQPRVWMPALGLLLVLSLVPSGFQAWLRPSAPGEGMTENTRLKGLEPRLYLYRKTGETAQSLASGDRVRAGDLIQVYYDAAGRGYGALFSLDREGKATWHLPDGGDRAAALATGRKVPLDFAFELDSTPGYERFYFLAADRPFSPDSALTAFLEGRAAGGREPQALPEGFFRASFELIKETGI